MGSQRSQVGPYPHLSTAMCFRESSKGKSWIGSCPLNRAVALTLQKCDPRACPKLSFFFFKASIYHCEHYLVHLEPEKDLPQRWAEEEHLQSSSCPQATEQQSGGSRLRAHAGAGPPLASSSDHWFEFLTPQSSLSHLSQRKRAGQECLGRVSLEKFTFSSHP